jgi:hypothetical protein
VLILNNRNKFFPESNQYKEKAEIKYLVRQNLFVLSLIVSVGILSLAYLLFIQAPLRIIFGLTAGFIVILVFNIASLSYGKTRVEFFIFNKFITSISFFTLMIIYVLYFKSPSVIPFLFLAYLITAVYKDVKVLAIISFYFILTIAMLLLNYGYLFDFSNNSDTSYAVIGLFVFLFLSLLMISTYITVKESQFFYNQISFSKEKELRNLKLLIDLKKKTDVEIFSEKMYYQKVENLFDDFSKKLKINNIFSEKIDIIRQISKDKSTDDILKNYPEYSKEDIERLKVLVLNESSRLRPIAMKIFYFNQKDIHEREIFSETHFQSFNKSSDSLEVKILTFSIFYTILKRGLSGTKPLTNEEIYKAVINSEFYYFIDPKIRSIFKENPDVFDFIYKDAFEGVAS